MEITPSNILEPIDPLNISFSADKCVKTPQTKRTTKEQSTPNHETVTKDLRDSLQYNWRDNQRKRYSTLKSERFQTVYRSSAKPLKTFLSAQQNFRTIRYKNVRAIKPFDVGTFGGEGHLNDLKKIDSLIKRVNARISLGNKILR